MKININFKLESRPARSHEVSDERLKSMVNQSRWATGIGMNEKRKFKCERRRTIDGYQYRIGDDIIQEPECFNQSEYMDWRDDK